MSELVVGGTSAEQSIFYKPVTADWSAEDLLSYVSAHNTGQSSLLYGLKEMLDDLRKIQTDDSYDDDYLKPTTYAVNKVCEWLRGAAVATYPFFPLGTVYPDGDGGIRVEWIRSEREVKLIVRADANGRSYIFHKEGRDYDGDYNVTSDCLGHWLNWLIDNATINSTSLSIWTDTPQHL